MKKKRIKMIELVPQSELNFCNIPETLSVSRKVFFELQNIV